MTQDLYTLELKFPMDFADRLEGTHKDGINAATVSALKLWVGLGDDIRDLITSQAQTEGMSRAEFIGRAVSKLMSPEPVTYADLFNGPTKTERREARDKEIVARGIRGVPRAQLAAMFNISEIRVHQIIRKGKAELTKEKLRRDWDPDPYEKA